MKADTSACSAIGGLVIRAQYRRPALLTDRFGTLVDADRHQAGPSADLLRVLAIIRVVLHRAFMVATDLPVIFPSMGVMFALGGSLMTKSMDRVPGARCATACALAEHLGRLAAGLGAARDDGDGAGRGGARPRLGGGPRCPAAAADLPVRQAAPDIAGARRLLR